VAARVRADVQVVLAADGDAAQGALSRVVVRVDAPVTDEVRQRGPVAQGVAGPRQCDATRMRRRCPSAAGDDPAEDIAEEGGSSRLASLRKATRWSPTARGASAILARAPPGRYWCCGVPPDLCSRCPLICISSAASGG
jgi:hypothetical protein